MFFLLYSWLVDELAGQQWSLPSLPSEGCMRCKVPDRCRLSLINTFIRLCMFQIDCNKQTDERVELGSLLQCLRKGLGDRSKGQDTLDRRRMSTVRRRSHTECAYDPICAFCIGRWSTLSISVSWPLLLSLRQSSGADDKTPFVLLTM